MRPKFGSRYFGRSEMCFSKGRRVVQPTDDIFYVPQGSSTNIIYSFLRFVVAIVTTNVTGKEIGILQVSDLLDFQYFGRYRSPLFCVLPPFPPPFFPKGGWLLKKGAIAPLLRKKGVTAPFLIPKCADRVFLRYSIGNTGEIPTEYRPKIPNWYTTLVASLKVCAHISTKRGKFSPRSPQYIIPRM